MSNWTAYGKLWFSVEVEGKSEYDAKMKALLKMMELEGMKINVRYIRAEPTEQLCLSPGQLPAGDDDYGHEDL